MLLSYMFLYLSLLLLDNNNRESSIYSVSVTTSYVNPTASITSTSQTANSIAILPSPLVPVALIVMLDPVFDVVALTLGTLYVFVVLQVKQDQMK